MSQPTATRSPGWGTIVLLGLLSTFGPMSIDMYLPAFPALAADLGATQGDVQMTLSAFVIGFAVGPLIYGPLSDRFGRKPVLLVGISLYIATSVGCALSPDIGWLIVFRCLSAFGGGAGTAISRAVVRDLFGRDQSARTMSLMSLIILIAPLIAPLLGGYVLVWFGWRAIFWFLAIFGAFCLLAAWIGLPETLSPENRRPSGFRAMARGYREVLGHRRAMGFMLCGGMSFAAMFAYLSGSPFVYIELYDLPPERYGLLFALVVVGSMVGAWINSRFVTRFGIHRMLAAALAIAVAGGAFLIVIAATGTFGIWGIVGGVMLFMAPHNITNANAAAGALEFFPGAAGTASAVLGCLRFGCGAVIGSLVGVFHDGTAVPMAATVLGAALMSALFYLLMARR